MQTIAWDTAGSGSEGVAADGIAIGFVQAPPGPAMGLAIGRVEGFDEMRMEVFVLGREEQFGGGPGDFVVVEEFVAVMGEFLIGAVGAEFFQSAVEEGPALESAVEVILSGLGIDRLEFGGAGGLSESGDSGGGG